MKQKPQPHPSDDQLSEGAQILKESEIDKAELQSALKTITKIKHIRKEGLGSLKKKNTTMKKLFITMSDFFVKKNNKNQVQERIEIRQKERDKRRQLRNKAILKAHHKKEEMVNEVINDDEESSTQRLENERFLRESHCYICHREYKKIDELYHQHCPECSEYSKRKRFQKADLKGLTALVTGGRIKIGYEIVLKLLRDGATVFATTRFTRDALIRYQKEKDYEEWKDRLFLLQCDFMSSSQVNELISYLKENIPRLDILINNAAQTLTRPKQFFTYELQNQQKEVQDPSNIVLEMKSNVFPSLQGQNISAIDNGTQEKVIDLGTLDEFGQPIDLRRKNTWRQKIQDVSLFDCVSTQLVNSIVPFHLISQLKCLMGRDKPSWIINVSSMEGVFYRMGKSYFHPHTNMAKAALNMITRTSAVGLKNENIFMNSVDTGWVTNENPINIAKRHERNHDFAPPLDCIEGAMRVIDPIYQGVNDGFFMFGKFLKDYKESLW